MTSLEILSLGWHLAKLAVLLILAVCVYEMFKNAPVVDDDDMEMSLLFGLVIPKNTAVLMSIPAAGMILICTILLMLTNWDEVTRRFRTGHTIVRKLDRTIKSK